MEIGSHRIVVRLRAVAADAQERITAEHWLLLFLLVASTYMFVTAFGFRRETALFPQFTAGGVILGCVLLLFRNYLPEMLQQFVSEPMRILEEEEQDLPDVEDDVEEEVGEEVSPSRPLSGATFTTLAAFLYVVSSYLFGMLWMTPLFIVVYGLWFRMRWYTIVALAALTYVIARIFMRLLFLPLDEGVFIS